MSSFVVHGSSSGAEALQQTHGQTDREHKLESIDRSTSRPRRRQVTPGSDTAWRAERHYMVTAVWWLECLLYIEREEDAYSTLR